MLHVFMQLYSENKIEMIEVAKITCACKMNATLINLFFFFSLDLYAFFHLLRQHRFGSTVELLLFFILIMYALKLFKVGVIKKNMCNVLPTGVFSPVTSNATEIQTNV